MFCFFQTQTDLRGEGGLKVGVVDITWSINQSQPLNIASHTAPPHDLTSQSAPPHDLTSQSAPLHDLISQSAPTLTDSSLSSPTCSQSKIGQCVNVPLISRQIFF